MKQLLLLAFFATMMAPASFAEGVASMTAVTAASRSSLSHHELTVVCRSQKGRTFVDLTFRPKKDTPFVACSITIYDKAGDKILLQIDPEIRRIQKLEGGSDGARVYFHIADELVDGAQIRYHLRANENQTHVYTIERGALRGLAARPD